MFRMLVDASFSIIAMVFIRVLPEPLKEHFTGGGMNMYWNWVLYVVE
jgi:hypothetical protein